MQKWDAIGIKDLRRGDFIKLGDPYLKGTVLASSWSCAMARVYRWR